MKNKIFFPSLTGIILCCINLVHAQYFQTRFNRDLSRTTFSPDLLNDGVCTHYNYANNDPSNYYYVGTGENIVTTEFVTADSLYNRMRFVRMNNNGGVSQNYGYSFSKPSENKMLNSRGLSVCEIPGTGSNNGYMVVGSVSSNDLTGSSVPGGRDALITRITGNGITKNPIRLRFNDSNSMEELYCVIASKTTPGVFYACGRAEGSSATKLIVVSFMTTGTVNWATTYHLDDNNPGTLTNECEGLAMAEDSTDGFLYVAGRYQNGTTIDALLIKINPSTHAVEWVQNHDLGSEEKYTNIKIDHDRNIILCGSTNYSNPRLMFTRFHRDGTLDWVKTYEIADAASGKDLLERRNTLGGYEFYIAVEIVIAGEHLNGICKINSSGNLVHCAPYAPLYSLNDKFMGLDTIPSSTSSGLSLFSQCVSDGTFGDSYVVKSYFNGATCIEACAALPGLTNTPALSIHYLEDNAKINYAVAKLSSRRELFQQAIDCSQITVSCGSSTRDGLTEENAQELHVDLFPNPVNDKACLKVRGREIPIEVLIYSSDGRLVQSLQLNSDVLPECLMIETETLASGIYTIHVRSSESAKTVKMLKP